MNLKLTGLEFRQGNFHLLANCEITASVTGLFGPSGAGKTTLLELIAGLGQPDAGCIELSGQTLTDVSLHQFVPPEKRNVGYVPQDLALFPHRTVRGNLLFATEGETDRFHQIVKALELNSLLSQHPGEISGGEKQRVAIGRALMRAPRILLLDEPLSSLDAPLKNRMLSLLKRTAHEFNTPILYVTHEPAELAAICDEVILIEKGRITAHGSFDDHFEIDNETRYKPIRNQTAA